MLDLILVELDSAILTGFVFSSVPIYWQAASDLSRTIVTTSFICPQNFFFSATEDNKASSWLNKIKGVGIYCLSFYKT